MFENFAKIQMTRSMQAPPSSTFATSLFIKPIAPISSLHERVSIGVYKSTLHICVKRRRTIIQSPTGWDRPNSAEGQVSVFPRKCRAEWLGKQLSGGKLERWDEVVMSKNEV